MDIGEYSVTQKLPPFEVKSQVPNIKIQNRETTRFFYYFFVSNPQTFCVNHSAVIARHEAISSLGTSLA